MLMIQELVKTIKSFQCDMVELKSGNEANKLLTQTELSGSATLPQTGSKVCSKSPLHKRVRDEDDADSYDEFESSDEGDHVFSLSEVGSAFMEAAFKTKMKAFARRKKMVKLGFLPANGQKHPNLTHLLLLPSSKTSLKLTTPFTKLKDSG